ncbi:MAG: C4-type zinc ribbon domain-containing protein [Acidobacteriota bacterium]
MERNLYVIVELQKTILTMERLKSLIKEGPARLERFDAEVKKEEEKLRSEKDGLESAIKIKRKEEGDLQLLHAKLEKYKDQLMTVKTNKEYTAMLHEIELCKKEIDRLEEDVIQKLYDIDMLQNEVKREEETFTKEKLRIEAEKERAEQEIREAEVEIGRLEARKGDLEKRLPENILKEFYNIASIRGGIAVARAEDYTCQACKLRLRPQVFLDVRANSGLISCENCGRFLYYEEGLNAGQTT